MISFNQKGNFSKTFNFLNNAKRGINMAMLEEYAQEGVEALSSATPVDSGLTARSWYYEITQEGRSVTISFHNTNIKSGVPIAILLQYGHSTKNGGWVQGRDFINPAIQPIFDKIAEKAWKEVTK